MTSTAMSTAEQTATRDGGGDDGHDDGASPPTHRAQSHDDDNMASSFPPPPPPAAAAAAAAAAASPAPSAYASLEGTLLCRRAAGSGPFGKQSTRLYCVLRMTDGDDEEGGDGVDLGGSGSGRGSLSCYRFVNLTKREVNAAYGAPTKLHGRDTATLGDDINNKKDNLQLRLDVESRLPWVVRDVENDPASFVLEIPTAGLDLDLDKEEDEDEDEDEDGDDDNDNDNEDDGEGSDVGYESDADEDGLFCFWGDDDDDDDENADAGDSSAAPDITTATAQGSQVKRDLLLASSKGRPLRYFFKCPEKKSLHHEKALWLRAFAKLGRLASNSQRRKRSLFGSAAAVTLAATTQRRSRIRTTAAADLATSRAVLEGGAASAESGRRDDDDEDDDDENGVREYRVRPGYAYPHRWMTHRELTQDMLAPSSQCHDLRLPPAEVTSVELGLLHVEVLQCLGLPRPRAKATSTGGADPNAVVYLACGSYAFATDVIPSCSSPMWLRGMRRACAVPVYHGYARLYAGVFHDESGGNRSGGGRDVFIGRVAVDLARLRPGCTYDVTLPLRLSTRVYSRRRRGAVRLRFHLDYRDEGRLALSYLPTTMRLLRPAAAGCDNRMTLTCGDPKAFRNVALTVHGRDLPGRFSTDQFMATIREFKFVQKIVQRLLQQFVKDLVVWEHPVISGFVFCAWMHCVYANSIALVPVYVASFVFLQLMGNYANCISGQGFLPPTFEEICCAVLYGSSSSGAKSPCIAPLDMKQREETPLSSLRLSIKDLTIETHEPRGKAFFRGIGLIGNENDYRVGASMEFPFSALAGYPRFGVEESLVKSKTRRRGSTTNNNSDRSNEASNSDAFGDEDDLDDVHDGQLIGSFHPSTGTPGEEAGDMPYQPRLHFKKPLPEQNIDNPLLKGDKTIKEELQEIEEKVNRATMNLFSEQAYVIHDTSRPAWGKRRRSEKDNENYDVKRHLDKLLNLGPYSQWNPVVGKITTQFEPIFNVVTVILCVYRALFNIFTWQDPYMSFWFSIGCVVSSAALFALPWRLIMFLVGVVGMGPQNWLIRLFRDFVWTDKGSRPSRWMRAFRELLKSNSIDERKRQKQKNKNEATAQPVFQCHAPANKPIDERKGGDSGVQHVVVPYSPLICQRFFDWPPDPKYARVSRGMIAPARMLSSQSRFFAVKEQVEIKPLPDLPRGKSLTQPVSQPEAPSSLPSLASTSSPSLRQSSRSSVTEKTTKDSSVAAAGSRFLKRTMNSLNESISATKVRDKDSLKNTIVSFRKNPSSCHEEDISVVSSELTTKQTEETEEIKTDKAGIGLLGTSKRLTSKFSRNKLASSMRLETESETTSSPFVSDFSRVKEEEDTEEATKRRGSLSFGSVSGEGVDAFNGNEAQTKETRDADGAACDIGLDRADKLQAGLAPVGVMAGSASEEQLEPSLASPSFLGFQQQDEPKTSGKKGGAGEDAPVPIPEQLTTAKVEVDFHDEDVSDVSATVTEQKQMQNETVSGPDVGGEVDCQAPTGQGVDDTSASTPSRSSGDGAQDDSASKSEARHGASPQSGDDTLLEDFVALKLELASARTANDHYREKLRQVEEERDSFRAKYEALQNETPKSQVFSLSKLKVPLGQTKASYLK